MTNTTPTLDGLSIPKLKAWARDNKSLATTVCTAMAFAEIERERVNAYVLPIFLRYAFTDAETGAALTDPSRLYLSDDDERCKLYYAECNAAHIANGWTGDPEFCPALVAEDLLVRAENLLLASLAEFVSVDGFYKLELRKKALDLALGVCLSKVS